MILAKKLKYLNLDGNEFSVDTMMSQLPLLSASPSLRLLQLEMPEIKGKKGRGLVKKKTSLFRLGN